MIDILLGKPATVLPYFGHRSRDRLVLTARALRADEFEFGEDETQVSSFEAMLTMARHFLSKEVAELPVTLEWQRTDGSTSRHEVTTDLEGFARFEIELEPEIGQPDHTAWETVTLHWENRDGAQEVDGHVLVAGKSVDLGIISDIDDTIIETGITGGFDSIAKNWRRVFAQMPQQRVAVDGAEQLYSTLGGGRVAQASLDTGDEVWTAQKRPFFYVSSSPWNLYSYLVEFKRIKSLPHGPIALRDWGFNRETLGSSSHGSHKVNAIKEILAMHDELRFALIGDDSQGDLTAYAEVAREYPERVAGIFIRRLAEPFSAEEEQAKRDIEALGIRLWLGESYDVGKEFIDGLGLDDNPQAQGGAEAIVETIEDASQS